MKRLHIATIALGFGLIASPAFAQDRGDRMWERLDKNGDGRIALSEVDERHRARLAAADANGDGYITRDEWNAHREKRRAESKARAFPDKDGDGVVSRAEFMAKAGERFDKLDADGDGVLTEEEMKAGAKRRGGWGRK